MSEKKFFTTLNARTFFYVVNKTFTTLNAKLEYVMWLTFLTSADPVLGPGGGSMVIVKSQVSNALALVLFLCLAIKLWIINETI